MSNTYDPNTDRGKVRLFVSDVGGTSGSDWLFSDEEIDAFLSMEGSSIYRAAAATLRAVAGNEVQVSKRIQFLELSTDGPSVSNALLKLADAYDKKADENDDAEGSGFEIARISTSRYPRWVDGEIVYD